MPQITSPISTPSGMPAKNPAHIGKNAGEGMHYSTRAAWLQAVTASADTVHWPDGQPMTVSDEADSGAVRVWRVSLGHARTARVGLYQGVLAANSNIVYGGVGVPDSGFGASGDWSVDPTTHAIYVKDSSTWVLTASADGSPIRQASRSGSSTATSNDKNTAIPFTAVGIYTLPAGLPTDPDFFVILEQAASGAVTVARGVGATMLVNGVDTASLSTAADGSSLVIRGSVSTNKYYVNKIGA